MAPHGLRVKFSPILDGEGRSEEAPRDHSAVRVIEVPEIGADTLGATSKVQPLPPIGVDEAWLPRIKTGSAGGLTTNSGNTPC